MAVALNEPTYFFYLTLRGAVVFLFLYNLFFVPASPLSILSSGFNTQ